MAERPSTTRLLIEQDGGVLKCTLNRPEVLNAIDAQQFRDLRLLFASLVNDNSVRVLVVTGAGRAFCAGGDIKEMARGEPRYSWPGEAITENIEYVRALHSIPQPVIAAVNGDAVGAGASLALFSDIVVAGESARFSDPHVRLGIVPSDGPIIWTLLLGINKAKEYLFTGRFISAQEAAAMGLVNHVCPDGEVLAVATQIATELASGATAALRWTKESLNRLVWDRSNLMLDLASVLAEMSMHTDDYASAIKARVTKRTPTLSAH